MSKKFNSDKGKAKPQVGNRPRSKEDTCGNFLVDDFAPAHLCSVRDNTGRTTP